MHKLLPTLGLLTFLACNSQTPIGVVDLDAATDTATGPLQPSLGLDAARDMAPRPLPPAGPPNQPSATLNLDGKYTCSEFDGDPYAGCPPEPQGGEFCDLPAGTHCDYQQPESSGGITFCTCNAVGAYNQFSCVSTNSPRPECPSDMPVHGSACTEDQRGLQCLHYIKPLACTCPGDKLNQGKERFLGCTCDDTTRTWRCESPAGKGAEPFDIAHCYKPSMPLPAGPTGIDTAKRLADLTGDEAQSLCAWWVEVQRAGGEPPLSSAPTVNGVWGDGFGHSGCETPVTLCLPRIPRDICTRLITRKPCGATVTQLTECLFTAMNNCQLVGTGCLPLNGDLNCSETIVQLRASVRPVGVSECAVPLE